MTEPDYTNVDIPRDRFGRPMILPPGRGTKRVPYRRTTTFVGCLDDTYGLMQWKQRQTALGMAQRKDLVLAAAACDPGDKRRLNDIADKACEHALSSASATTGTALHSLTERIDRGKPLGVIPAEYEADIKAYEKATATIEWVGIESFRVHDDWQVAGTADRIGWWRGQLVIADIKGLAVDTNLPTPSGWTTMAAVQPGDHVLDADGNPCKVVRKSDIKRIGTFIVTFSDGAQVVCDSEHIWWTTTAADRRAGRGPQPRPVLDIIATLKYAGQNQHCVPVTAALNLPDADLPIEPYLLGAWLGDGNRNRGAITKENDLFDILESDGHQIRTRYTDRRTGAVSATVIGLQSSLRAANMLGDKRIPDTYMRASHHQRLRLLQGLMDTDGTWNTARKRAMFTSTCKTLSLAVEELLLTLGQQPHISSVARSGFGKSVTAYDVEFTPVGITPFRLPRKAAKVLTGNQTHASRRVIIDIAPGPDVETACIGVDSPNNVYLCSERMIPTHNTGSIEFPHKMAMQLAMYSRMIPYDIATDTRGEDPARVDPNVGLIIHLPAGQGRCDIHTIDIGRGWGGCLIAHKVWAWRATKGLTEHVTNPDAPAPTPATWASVARRTNTVEELRELWRTVNARGQLDDDFRAAARQRSEELLAATTTQKVS